SISLARRTRCPRRSRRACSSPRRCWSISACRWVWSSPRSTRSGTSIARSSPPPARRNGRARHAGRDGGEARDVRRTCAQLDLRGDDLALEAVGILGVLNFRWIYILGEKLKVPAPQEFA